MQISWTHCLAIILYICSIYLSGKVPHYELYWLHLSPVFWITELANVDANRLPGDLVALAAEPP